MMPTERSSQRALSPQLHVKAPQKLLHLEHEMVLFLVTAILRHDVALRSTMSALTQRPLKGMRSNVKDEERKTKPEPTVNLAVC